MHTTDDHDSLSVSESETSGWTNTDLAWAEYHLPLRRFISRRLRQTIDVDDVLQTLFLNFHRQFSGGEPPIAAGAWLYRSARHAIIDRYRSAHRRREDPVGSLEALDALPSAVMAASVEHAPLPSAAAGCVRPLVAQLSAIDRDALTLTDLGGATQQEAAVRVGVSVPGMKARVQRARRRLEAAFHACCDLTFDGRGAIVSVHQRRDRPTPCAGKQTASARARMS